MPYSDLTTYLTFLTTVSYRILEILLERCQSGNLACEYKIKKIIHSHLHLQNSQASSEERALFPRSAPSFHLAHLSHGPDPNVDLAETWNMRNQDAQ